MDNYKDVFSSELQWWQWQVGFFEKLSLSNFQNHPRLVGLFLAACDEYARITIEKETPNNSILACDTMKKVLEAFGERSPFYKDFQARLYQHLGNHFLRRNVERTNKKLLDALAFYYFNLAAKSKTFFHHFKKKKFIFVIY